MHSHASRLGEIWGGETTGYFKLSTPRWEGKLWNWIRPEIMLAMERGKGWSGMCGRHIKQETSNGRWWVKSRSWSTVNQWLVLIQCHQESPIFGAVKKETLASAKQLNCYTGRLWGSPQQKWPWHLDLWLHSSALLLSGLFCPAPC